MLLPTGHSASLYINHRSLIEEDDDYDFVSKFRNMGDFQPEILYFWKKIYQQQENSPIS